MLMKHGHEGGALAASGYVAATKISDYVDVG